MNTEPNDAIRVDAATLGNFTHAVLTAAGFPQEHAQMLARLLIESDLRGNYSHGSLLISWYAEYALSGKLNLNPNVTTVRESPVSLALDGDGGLGYFPLWQGMHAIIDKANAVGMAALTTCHHEHIGAAGHYARLALEHDMVCMVTTGHQLEFSKFNPENRKLYVAGGGSAMAFSAPTRDEASFVLDFGAMHDLYNHDKADELMKQAPGMLMRNIGLGEVTQIFGGLLAGLPSHASRNPRNVDTPRQLDQGAFAFVAKIDLFTDAATFRTEMDEYVRQVATLIPPPGFDQCYMPGGAEAARVTQNTEAGVPLGNEHRKTLERIASKLAVDLPWA